MTVQHDGQGDLKLRKEEDQAKRDSVRRLVVTVHGIRTFGQWQERLEGLLKEKDSNIAVVNIKFGYFSIFAFVIPFLRWLVTRWFRRELLRIVARYPDAERIDIVAHSFGTHLVGWGLSGMARKERPSIHTIILAGSVLRSDFRWDELEDDGTVGRLVNECGIHDSILLLNQIFVLFTGMAGRVGFTGATHEKFRNRFYRFGHSGYFEPGPDEDDENAFMRARWIPLLTTTGTAHAHDERESGNLEGALVFLLGNAEPIKLMLWMTPMLVAILYVNSLRVDAVRAAHIATGTSLHAQALQHFAESKRYDAESEKEEERRRDLEAEHMTFRGEYADTAAAVLSAREKASEQRSAGLDLLEQADKHWQEALASGLITAQEIPPRPRPLELFSIEVFEVGSGEAFMVHYGSLDDPRFILIDGGGSSRDLHRTILPRLLEIRDRWGRAEQALPIELVINSNIDDDRIDGLLQLAGHMQENREAGNPRLFDVQRFWLNGWIHSAGSSSVPAPAVFSTGVPWRAHRLASLRQASSLAQLLQGLGIPVNIPFDHLVTRAELGATRVRLDGGLVLTVLNPTEENLYRLWVRARESTSKRGRRVGDFVPETFSQIEIETGENCARFTGSGEFGKIDRSLSNLASIVVLFELAGKRFLHTGDARGDLIVDGLSSAGLLSKEGIFSVDVMLIPHYGSDRNVGVDFFRHVIADTYLFTGDGKFGNPDLPTLEMIAEARSDDVYTFMFVNRSGKAGLGERLQEFFADRPESANFRVVVRGSQRRVLAVDLLEPLRY